MEKQIHILSPVEESLINRNLSKANLKHVSVRTDFPTLTQRNNIFFSCISYYFFILCSYLNYFVFVAV